jgi:hypothetical protein
VVRESLRELSARYPATVGDGPAAPRGEIALVVDLGAPAGAREVAAPEAAARALLGRGLSRRDAAAALHVCLGVPRREAEALTRRLAAEP